MKRQELISQPGRQKREREPGLEASPKPETLANHVINLGNNSNSALRSCADASQLLSLTSLPR